MHNFQDKTSIFGFLTYTLRAQVNISLFLFESDRKEKKVKCVHKYAYSK